LESGFSELRMKFFEKHTLTQNSRFATACTELASVHKSQVDNETNHLGASEGVGHHRRHADALEAVVDAAAGHLNDHLQLNTEREQVMDLLP